MLRDSFDDEKRILNEEIDSLKDREDTLKKQLEIVSKHFDEVRQANIDINLPGQTEEQKASFSEYALVH